NLGAPGREHAHGGGLPAGVYGKPEQHLPYQEGDAEFRVLDGIKAGAAHGARDFGDDIVPTGVVNRVNRHHDRGHRQQDILNEIRDDHGHNPADDRIDEFQQQNCRHDRNEVPAIDSAHDGQEFAFDLQEHAHVEDAPDRNQDP